MCRIEVLSPLILLLLLAGGVVAGDQREAKEQELEQVRDRIKNLQSSLVDTQQRQGELQDELAQAERMIGETVGRLRRLSADLEAKREQLLQLQRQRSAQQEKLRLQRMVLADQLRSAYAMGRQERIKIFLNQQDPATISRVMAYYDYLNRARTEQIRSIDAILEELHAISLEQEREERQLLTLQEQELKQMQQLEQAQQARQEVMAALSSQLRDKGRELSDLQETEKALQELVNRLQDELASLPLEYIASKSFKELKGKLDWPSTGRITARFGTGKSGNLKWDGVMIAAPEGREVRALHHGRVAFADWLRGFGLLLIIDHGNGYMSLYGYNQSLFKEVGDWVEPGETVALVGNSGGQQSTGVYFGIRHEGRPLNPKHWCKRIKGNRIGGLPPLPAIPARSVATAAWITSLNHESA